MYYYVEFPTVAKFAMLVIYLRLGLILVLDTVMIIKNSAQYVHLKKVKEQILKNGLIQQEVTILLNYLQLKNFFLGSGL